ncbi:hypothetical protein J2754_001593 [Halarchaeum solikamskense]|uniref:hypothetical protein n=1 Tax=Halarchaeum nitratireducens TaxID=489913 RepID=UPI001B3AB86A|nr:hypothetical protein [Halarchaeum solikamskense]MBP2251272.1 hypothetical protein [Halarchaeum solikamskense]
MSNSNTQRKPSIDYPDDPSPTHDVASWHPRVETLPDDGGVDAHPINYVSNDSPATARPAPGTVGWVISRPETVADYVAEHGHGTIDVPQYYSRFPDIGAHNTPDREDYIAVGPGLESDEGNTVIDPRLVCLAIRVLNGKGRYPADEHTLYDCLPLPCPLVRDEVGAVIIAPRVAPNGLDD